MDLFASMPVPTTSNSGSSSGSGGSGEVGNGNNNGTSEPPLSSKAGVGVKADKFIAFRSKKNSARVMPVLTPVPPSPSSSPPSSPYFHEGAELGVYMKNMVR